MRLSLILHLDTVVVLPKTINGGKTLKIGTFFLDKIEKTMYVIYHNKFCWKNALNPVRLSIKNKQHAKQHYEVKR